MDYFLCRRCHKNTKRNSNAQKYCKNCAIVEEIQKRKKRARKQRNSKSLLKEHMLRHEDGSPDFEAEAEIIKKEIKRLGLGKR